MKTYKVNVTFRTVSSGQRLTSEFYLDNVNVITAEIFTAWYLTVAPNTPISYVVINSCEEVNN